MTVAQKTWLAQMLTSNVIRANELSDLLEVKRQFQLCEMLKYQLNVDVLRKWKRLMKQGQHLKRRSAEAAICEGYQKNLPPAVVYDHDASQYGMGKVDWNLRSID